MYFAKLYDILQSQLYHGCLWNCRCRERTTSGPVKRETGERPVRTRHCIRGVWKPEMPLSNREGGFYVKICESGDLPAGETGKIPDHE